MLSLKTLAEQMQITSDELSQFINKSGEMITVEDRFLSMADSFDESALNLSEGETAEYNIAKDIIENFDDYKPMPGKQEIGEYGMMEEFSENYPDEHIKDCLCIAISGKGAFRRFKDIVNQFGIEKEWYEYRDAEY